MHDDLWFLLAAVLVAERSLPVASGPAELDRLRRAVRMRFGSPAWLLNEPEDVGPATRLS